MAQQRIDLNSAVAEELTQLPGIGSTLAERIIAYRETIHPFEEPAQIAAVSGIGERTYSKMANKLAVGPAQEDLASNVEDSEEEAEEEGGAPEGAEVQEIAVPRGESISKAGPDLKEPASEERWPEAGEETPEMPEEGRSVDEERPAPEVAEEDESDEEERAGAEAAAEKQRSRKAPAEERGLPAPSSEQVARSRSLWSRLSWLWTAMLGGLLGGLLGMIFTLVVFAGVNGSLDIAHSRAVLSIESRIDDLTADVDALQGGVAGLRRRLDALEGLTTRMDDVESAVDDLREETTDLSGRTELLEEDVAAVSEEVEVLSDAVATLQEQAGRTRDFFLRLQRMLNDLFGEVGGESPPSTPESK
jgi:competence ComEA-like helix-hairpin-helix protein